MNGANLRKIRRKSVGVPRSKERLSSFSDVTLALLNWEKRNGSVYDHQSFHRRKKEEGK